MITLPVELIRIANELHVDTPWVHLVQLQIRTSTGPDVFDTRRVTNHNESISFHGDIFNPYPFKLGTIEQNSSSEIRRLTVSAANIDQVLIALLEQYWASVIEPLWIFTIWAVNTANPSLTPLASTDRFVALNAKTDFFNVTFECQYEALSLRKIVPFRRFTRAGGFANIPRRLR